MKKIYGFLGAAALMTMAACSNDFDGPKGPKEESGDLYMTMTISAQTTRTETESQGKEIGKDRENAIKSGLLIIADYNTGKTGFQTISYATIAEGDIAGSSPTYATSFKMARTQLLDYIGAAESKEFYLFLIANPTEAIIQKYNTTPGIDIQKTFDLTSDADTYWSKTESNFLMTSASLAKTTIQKSELAPGKHTTKADALNLGEVEVQRAMSRFDLATGDTHIEFKTESSNSTLSDITIKFDAVALVNMAQTANLFKEVGMAKTTFDQDANGVTEGKWGYFHKETKTVYTDATNGDWTVTTEGNYVFAPDQTAYTYPLFTGGSGNNQNGGQLLEHKSFFAGNSHTLISAITEPDNEYSHPNETTPAQPTDIGYNIWRYCMPNANSPKTNQYNGNSTGIIFRAEMTGSKITGEEPLYAYNNVILGTFAQLKSDYIDAEKVGDTATDAEKEIFNMVRVRYAEAKAKAKEANSNTDVTEDAEHLDTYLVAQGFTIYRPESGKFYCYYIYWNRHNDNGNNAVMGAMEFATVRNNVYKISVNKITKLGHPGVPGDDPDPEDPGTPDEKDEFWGEITCKVLPWEVRINNVEF